LTSILASTVWHRPHRKHYFQQFLYCCELIRLCGNMSSAPLCSNGQLLLFH
jgi:hypothetical protein